MSHCVLMKRDGFRVIDILSIFKTQGRCSHGCRSVLMSLSSSTIGIRKRPVTAKKEQWKWLDSVHRACDTVLRHRSMITSLPSPTALSNAQLLHMPAMLLCAALVRVCASALAIVWQKIYDVDGFKFFSQKGSTLLNRNVRDGAEFLILLNVNKYWTCYDTCVPWIVRVLLKGTLCRL